MIGFTLLLFPFVLLGFIMLMGRVEQPLSHAASERDIEEFLETANRSELDTLVTEGTESAMNRHQDRMQPTRRRWGWRRSTG